MLLFLLVPRDWSDAAIGDGEQHTALVELDGVTLLHVGDAALDPDLIANTIWSAKEAVLKALGADVRGVPYRDIEIVPAAAGPPGVVLHGEARRLFEAA